MVSTVSRGWAQEARYSRPNSEVGPTLPVSRSWAQEARYSCAEGRLRLLAPLVLELFGLLSTKW